MARMLQACDENREIFINPVLATLRTYSAKKNKKTVQRITVGVALSGAPHGGNRGACVLYSIHCHVESRPPGVFQPH